MPVAAPTEGYLRMINYANKKSSLRIDQLALQTFMAGFWVAVVGHACTFFASSFFDDGSYSAGLTRLAYGTLFPGAFVAVVYTGTELYTGNTVTMVMLVLEGGRKQLRNLCRIWGFSLIGNATGAIFGAWLLSWSSNVFHSEGRPRDFLFTLVEHKVGMQFHEALCLGIGCNCLVCLATWACVVSDDGAGKILAIYYTIGVFAMGGMEHVIANFYTITLGYMCGFNEYSFGRAILFNFIPVLIGNTVAGTVLTGTMWWYALHPQYSDLAPYSDKELMVELSRRASSAAITKTGTTFVDEHFLTPSASTIEVGKRDESRRWLHTKSFLPHHSPTKDYSYSYNAHRRASGNGGAATTAQRDVSTIAALPLEGGSPRRNDDSNLPPQQPPSTATTGEMKLSDPPPTSP